MNILPAVGSCIDLYCFLIYRLWQGNSNEAFSYIGLPACRKQIKVQQVSFGVSVIVNLHGVFQPVLLSSRHIGVIIPQAYNLASVFIVGMHGHVWGVHILYFQGPPSVLIFDRYVPENSMLLLMEGYLNVFCNLIAVVLSHSYVNIVAVGGVGHGRRC